MFTSPAGKQTRRRMAAASPNSAIQFSLNGTQTGDPNFTWNSTIDLLTVGNSTVNSTANSTAYLIGAINATAVGVVLTNSSLSFGNSSINTTMNSSTISTWGPNFTVITATTTAIPLTVKGAASATANLFQVSNSGSVIFAINSLGVAVGNGAGLTSCQPTPGASIAVAAGVTSVNLSGTSGLSTTGGLNVLANSGLIANSTGLFVAASGNGISIVAGAGGVIYADNGSGIVCNTTGIHVLGSNGILANSTGAWVVAANGIQVLAGVNVLANAGVVANSTGTWAPGAGLKSFCVPGPVALDVYPIFWTNTAVTITEIVTVVTNTAASPGINTAFYSGTTLGTVVATILGTTNTSNITTGLHTTSFSTAAVAANSWVWCNVNTVSSINTFAATIRLV